MEPNTNPQMPANPNPSPFIPQANPVPPTAPMQNQMPSQMPPQMQTPPPMPPQPTMQPVYAPTPGKSKALIAILVIIVALAIVGGVGAYVFTAKRPDPKVVLKNAIVAMSNVKSFAYSGELIGSGTTTPQPDIPLSGGTFNFKVNGKVDAQDPKNRAVDTNIDFKIHSGGNGDIFDANLSAETMVFEKIGYAQLKDLMVTYTPAKPNFQLSAIVGAIQGVVGSVKGHWVSFDIPTPSTPEKTPEDVTKKVVDKLMSLDYIDSIEQLGDETVSGVSSYHYRITLNKEKSQGLLDDAKKTSSLIQNNELAAAIANRATTAASEKVTPFDIWIGKKDSYVYRISVPKTAYDDAPSKSSVTMSFKLDLSGFNTSLKITPPANSITAEEFMSQIMGRPATPSASSNEGKDAAIKANLQSLRASAELAYNDYGNNNSYINLCKNGTINTAYKFSTNIPAQDKPDTIVKNILMTKGVTTQSQAGIVCVNSKENYAISIPLTNGDTECIDSKGYYGIAKIDKTKMACVQK